MRIPTKAGARSGFKWTLDLLNARALMVTPLLTTLAKITWTKIRAWIYPSMSVDVRCGAADQEWYQLT